MLDLRIGRGEPCIGREGGALDAESRALDARGVHWMRGPRPGSQIKAELAPTAAGG